MSIMYEVIFVSTVYEREPNINPQVYFEGNVGKKNEPMIPSTFQDNDSVFTFSPASSWSQSPRPGTFSGSTGT